MIEAIMPTNAIAIGNMRNSTVPTLPASAAARPPPAKAVSADRSNDRTGVRLEQVGAHARDIADVVAHVVGDGGGVARVVFRDAGLDLADEVCADIGGLGVNAAAHAGEECDRRCAEPDKRSGSRRPDRPRTTRRTRGRSASDRRRARPATVKPITAPPRNATGSALPGPCLAASVVRALAMVATVMPT